MIENRMVIDSEWPDETPTPWENADTDDIADWLFDTGRIDDAVKEYIDGLDPSELYELFISRIQEDIVEQYANRHNSSLSSEYNDDKRGYYNNED